MGFQCKIEKMVYLVNDIGISRTKHNYYLSLYININSKGIKGSELN